MICFCFALLVLSSASPPPPALPSLGLALLNAKNNTNAPCRALMQQVAVVHEMFKKNQRCFMTAWKYSMFLEMFMKKVDRNSKN